MTLNYPFDKQQSSPDRAAALAVASALRNVAALWAADDIAGVSAAATTLMRGLDLRVTVSPAGAEAQCTDRDAVSPLRVPLSGGQFLIVATPKHEDQSVLLQTAAALVRMRSESLSEKVALMGSVKRLGRSETLQRALYAIADQAGMTATEPMTMYRALHQIVGTLMYAKNLYIALYDRIRQTVRFAYYADVLDTSLPSPDHELPITDIANGPTWHVLRSGKSLRGSLEAIATQLGRPVHGIGATPHDWLGVPLLREHDVVGCVAIQTYDGDHHYTEQDQELLTFVAQHIETALERRSTHARLRQQVDERTRALRNANEVLEAEVRARKRNERLQQTLFQIAALASTTVRIQDFYAAAHRAIGNLLYAQNFYLALLTNDRTQLSFPYVADERNGDASPRPFGPGGGLTEYVIRTGRPLLADAQVITQLHASGEVTRPSDGAVCWLGVPLTDNGRTVGALVVQSYRTEHRYSAQDQELLSFVSHQIANTLARIRANESLRLTLTDLEARVAIRTRELAAANRELRIEIGERERVEARLQHAAWYDSLTGIPNRACFMERLTEAFARYVKHTEEGFALLFMDLDRFKAVNDSEGHLVGDQLLAKAGARIRACLKTEDLVARLGGDEFGALLAGVHDIRVASKVAERIISGLNAPFRLADKDVFTSISIGVAVSTPYYETAEQLLRDADSAMYRAKADNQHRWVAVDTHPPGIAG